MVGLVPSVAFAATNPPNAVTNIIVRQIGKGSVRISWDLPITNYEIDAYDVLINNGYSKEDVTVNSLDVLENLDFGVNYKVTIVAKNDIGTSTASKSFVLSSFVEEDISVGGLIDSGDQKNLKNVAGQNMHGNYKNNTNTCANCHSTHQARSGSGLTIKSSSYESCISCHDGSLGFYNVFETDMSKDNGAGTFGGSYSGNMSIHLATGNTKIDSSPGAAVVKNVDGTSIKNEFIKGKWNNNFTCTSCHSPHGSSNDRLLQTDPNGYSSMERHLVNGVYYGGLIKKEIEVIDKSEEDKIFNGVQAAETVLNAIIPENETPFENYKAVRIQIITDDKITGRYDFIAKDDYVICIYKYDKYLGTWIPVKFKQVGPFSGDGIDLLTGPSETEKLVGWKSPVDSENVFDGEKLTEGYLSIGWYGYVKVPNEVVANQVKYVTNIATLFDFEFEKTPNIDTEIDTYKVDHITTIEKQSGINDPDPEKVKDAKKAMSNLNQFNEWCATCHIGFNISNEQKESLGSTVVYTHHSSSEDDKLPCIQCHYSHGTDATWMKGADDLTFAELMSRIELSDFTTLDGKIIRTALAENERSVNVLAYLNDTNSALKRYSNTTSCFRCHGTESPSN
jgi:hypothetical protein